MEYESKIRDLEAYVSSIEDPLHKLKLIIIAIAMILVSITIILGVLYVKGTRKYNRVILI